MLLFILLAAVCALIVTAHVLAALAGPRLQAAATILGVCLHVPLLLLLLSLSVSMETAVAVLLGSITLYTALAAWGERRKARAVSQTVTDGDPTADPSRGEEADA